MRKSCHVQRAEIDIPQSIMDGILQNKNLVNGKCSRYAP